MATTANSACCCIVPSPPPSLPSHPPAAVVKAVLLAALYPNVAVMDDEAVPGGMLLCSWLVSGRGGRARCTAAVQRAQRTDAVRKACLHSRLPALHTGMVACQPQAAKAVGLPCHGTRVLGEATFQGLVCLACLA